MLAFFGLGTYSLTLPPPIRVKTKCPCTTNALRRRWSSLQHNPFKSHDHSLRATVQAAKNGVAVGTKSEHPCFFNLQKVILHLSKSHRRTSCQKSKFRRPSCPGWNHLPVFPGTNRTADLAERKNGQEQTKLEWFGRSGVWNL